MKRFFKRALIVIAGICLSTMLIVSIMYQKARNNYTQQLESASQIMKTNKGPIEYVTMGDNQSAYRHLLVLHGTPGGYDAGVLVANWLNLDDDTHVIIPSRPGYLRTPIEVGITPAAAADAMIALLDELKVEKVTVLGWSGGGPTAVELAQRHPGRVANLILLSARIMSDGKYRFESTDKSDDPFDPNIVDVSADFFGPDFKAFAKILGLDAMPDFLVYRFFPEGITHMDLTVERLRQLAPTTQPPSRRNIGRHNDYWQFASLPEKPRIKIGSRTLLIYSNSDVSVGIAHGYYMNKAIPHSELLIVENESHFSVLTPEISEKVRQFLTHEK